MVNSLLCMACAYRSVEHGLEVIEDGTFAPRHACGEVIFIENGASRNGNCVRSDIFRALVASTQVGEGQERRHARDPTSGLRNAGGNVAELAATTARACS